MKKYQLPGLPYPDNALEPHISAETVKYHYAKHHASYVDKLNKLITGTEFATAPLEEIIHKARGGIFNNAAQAWNRTFYWKCLSPDGGGQPDGALADAINTTFTGFTNFKERFSGMADSNFGSGWTWLVQNSSGGLEILSTSNAANPLTDSKQPLLTCHVWEHASHIDYHNACPEYIDTFWNLVNWDFVEQNLVE